MEWTMIIKFPLNRRQLLPNTIINVDGLRIVYTSHINEERRTAELAWFDNVYKYFLLTNSSGSLASCILILKHVVLAWSIPKLPCPCGDVVHVPGTTIRYQLAKPDGQSRIVQFNVWCETQKLGQNVELVFTMPPCGYGSPSQLHPTVWICVIQESIQPTLVIRTGAKRQLDEEHLLRPKVEPKALK